MNPQDAEHKYFLKTFFIAAALALLAIGGFNLIVDPLGVYGIVNKKGFNEKKVAKERFMDIAKTMLLRKHRFDTLLFGTSRTQVGLRATHPGFGLHGPSNAYNLAFPGNRLYEMLRYFEFAAADNNMRRAVIGLDFFQFNANTPLRPNFDESRLQLDSNGHRAYSEAVQDVINSLFSYDMLLASFNTIGKQRRDNFRKLSPDGRLVYSEETVAKSGGHYALFFDKSFGLDEFSFVNRNGVSSFSYIRKIIASARSSGVQIIFFIPPVHALELEELKAVGKYELLEEWKRELVKIIAEDASMHPEEAAYELYDFTGYSSLTTEDVPPKGDRTTKMKYYYEASHFRPELGDYVLDRVLGYNDPSRNVPSDFGVRLTKPGIERHLEKLRTDGQLYEKEHPEYIKKISELNRAGKEATPE